MERSSEFALRSKDTGDRIEITGEIVVGRSAECGLVISEGEVSRRHAKLKVTDAGLDVEDLGSSNGTFVNERRITGATRLKGGDVVRFDRIAYDVLGGAGGAAPAASDSERTVMHSREELLAELQASRPKTPGGWVDPSNARAGTSVMSQEELKQALAQMSGAQSAGAAEAPQLRILSGRQQGRIIALEGSKTRWTVGSDPDRDIALDDDGVSRQHAEITSVAGRWKLVDQMSANHTFVNDGKVITAFLASGDRLRFGAVEAVVEGIGSAAAKPSKSGSGVWIAIAIAALALAAAGAYLMMG